MQMSLRHLATLALPAALLLPGCATDRDYSHEHHHHHHQRPPDRVEVVTVAPRPDMRWVPGYWIKQHHEWVWVSGHWA